MRDYRYFDQCLDRLTGDVYSQPSDEGHTTWASQAIEQMAIWVYKGNTAQRDRFKVLDVGCGQGFLYPIFKGIGMDWTGVAIGEDVEMAKENLKTLGEDQSRVHAADMTFLPFRSGYFDLIFARHVLEHSPFPVITLMEWRRVVHDKGQLCLVAPAPHNWGYRGKNHYSIAPMPLLKWWTERAGWHMTHEFTFTNRDPLYLKHLEPYQDGYVFPYDIPPPPKTKEEILESYPEGPVEFRLICKAGEEVIE